MKIRNSIKAGIEHLKIKKGMVENQVKQLDRQILEKEEKKIHESQNAKNAINRAQSDSKPDLKIT